MTGYARQKVWWPRDSSPGWGHPQQAQEGAHRGYLGGSGQEQHTGKGTQLQHRALQRELSLSAVALTKVSPSSTGKITKFSELCSLQPGNKTTYRHCHENFRRSVQIMREHTCLCTPHIHVYDKCLPSSPLPGTIKNVFLHHVIKNSTLMSLCPWLDAGQRIQSDPGRSVTVLLCRDHSKQELNKPAEVKATVSRLVCGTRV